MQKVLLEITIISCLLAFPSFSSEFSSRSEKIALEVEDYEKWVKMEDPCIILDRDYSEQRNKISIDKAMDDQNRVNQSINHNGHTFLSIKTDIQIQVVNFDAPKPESEKAKPSRKLYHNSKGSLDRESSFTLQVKPGAMPPYKSSGALNIEYPHDESDSPKAMSVCSSPSFYDGELCYPFEEEITASQVPDDLNHIAIIFDGSRRWAKDRNLSSSEGHKVFIELIPLITADVFELKIHTLTVWVLSTENWQRDPEEIKNGMIYFEELFEDLLILAHQLKIKIVHMGRKDRVPASLKDKIIRSEAETSGYNNHILNVALDYGGRDEIVRAIKKLNAASVDFGEITEELITANLDTAYQPNPNPDLVIRTSDIDLRTSGFMPWQSKYSEWYFTGSYAPEFRKKKCLSAAILAYKKRIRLFSK